MINKNVLIQARGICVSFGKRQVLDHIDLDIESGEIVTLLGLNGAGKSTLVKTLLGLVKPSAGSVVRRAGLTIGYSPQYIQRDATLPITVARFLNLAVRTSVQTTRIEQVLAEVGAPDIAKRQLSEISGGEMQRVLLARALIRQPDLLVLDEPLAGVDVLGQSELYRLIARIRDRYHCGILLVSHDLHVVMAATDRVVCLNHHICCTGHPHSVAKDPEFAALFGQSAAEVLAVYSHQHDHRHDVSGEELPLCTSAHDHHDSREHRHGG